MKLPFVTAVVGTSFRPEVAARAAAGAPVLLSHEPTNEVDPNAIKVELDGEQLGYLPRALAARLPGGPWHGEIVDVFGDEHVGIRVRVTQLADQRRDTDLTVRTLNSNVAATASAIHTSAAHTSPTSGRPDSTGDSHQNVVVGDVAPVRAIPELVRARSGRVLGYLVNIDGDRLQVRTDDGRVVTYPSALVERQSVNTPAGAATETVTR